MTGQDAVTTAEAFHETLELDGVILTKLDGDARGGAALSVKEVVGRPIAFASTGEKLEDFDLFHPDRLAGRILGMGDMLTLIEKAEEVFEKDEAEEAATRLLEGQFTLDDFLEQMQQLKKMGPLSGILGMLPGVPKEVRDAEIDDREIARIEAIIRSMTAGRAGRPRPDRRLPPGPHRHGLGDRRHPGRRPRQAVQRDPQDDEADGGLRARRRSPSRVARRPRKGQGPGRRPGRLGRTGGGRVAPKGRRPCVCPTSTPRRSGWPGARSRALRPAGSGAPPGGREPGAGR